MNALANAAPLAANDQDELHAASTLADQQVALIKMLEWKKKRSAEVAKRLDEERLSQVKTRSLGG